MLFQIVLGRFSSFQLVLPFSKYVPKKRADKFVANSDNVTLSFSIVDTEGRNLSLSGFMYDQLIPTCLFPPQGKPYLKVFLKKDALFADYIKIMAVLQIEHC